MVKKEQRKFCKTLLLLPHNFGLVQLLIKQLKDHITDIKLWPAGKNQQ